MSIDNDDILPPDNVVTIPGDDGFLGFQFSPEEAVRYGKVKLLRKLRGTKSINVKCDYECERFEPQNPYERRISESLFVNLWEGDY